MLRVYNHYYKIIFMFDFFILFELLVIYQHSLCSLLVDYDLPSIRHLCSVRTTYKTGCT